MIHYHTGLFALALIIASLPAFAQELHPVPEAAATICVSCHTIDGIGKDVEIPNLAGQHAIYLENQLKAFRSGRRKHAEMKFISRELPDAEIRQLAEYYASLPPR